MMPNTDSLPIFGICGFSGSGKTTLIVELLSRLQGRGLKVAVVKHSSSRLQLDTPGKDSDRFFQAGAHVYLSNDRESFVRGQAEQSVSFTYQLSELARLYDLVLVEGYKHTPISKVWLLAADEAEPPADCEKIMANLPWDNQRAHRLLTLLDLWLPQVWRALPVYGCVLIGGQSSRMGRPKHGIAENGITWLERTMDKLAVATDRVVISGNGDIPRQCRAERIPDLPGFVGPMAGMVAALRWNPWVVWLMVACDLPDLEVAALHWLLGERQPGRWAILPTVGDNRAEPLLACYDFRSQRILEEMAFRGEWRPSRVGRHPKVVTPAPPPVLAGSWRNVNTPEEIRPRPE